jgi:hypothetical protein
MCCRWALGSVSPSTIAKNPELGIAINSSFDSGNIEVRI